MILKKKYLGGLFYKKFDTIDKNFIIRILGIKFLYSKVNILTSTECIYLNGINKPIFEHNIRIRITNMYKQNIIEEYPEYDSFIIFASGFGEIFHFLFNLNEYLIKYNISRPLIIFSKKSLQRLYKLYSNLNYSSCVIEDLTGLMCEQYSIYKNKKFIVPLNFDYFGNVENNIIKKGAHYYGLLKDNFDLKLNYNDIKLSISTNVKLVAKKIFEEKLNSKFVILCPEASTMELLPYDFWFRLAKN